MVDEHGRSYIDIEDLSALLRAMGSDYLQHIPAHVEVGEFYEALLDRHADYILGEAANYFEKGPSSNAG